MIICYLLFFCKIAVSCYFCVLVSIIVFVAALDTRALPDWIWRYYLLTSVLQLWHQYSQCLENAPMYWPLFGSPRSELCSLASRNSQDRIQSTIIQQSRHPCGYELHSCFLQFLSQGWINFKNTCALLVKFWWYLTKVWQQQKDYILIWRMNKDLLVL